MKPRERSVNFSKFICFSFYKRPVLNAPAMQHVIPQGLEFHVGILDDFCKLY